MSDRDEVTLWECPECGIDRDVYSAWTCREHGLKMVPVRFVRASSVPDTESDDFTVTGDELDRCLDRAERAEAARDAALARVTALEAAGNAMADSLADHYGANVRNPGNCQKCRSVAAWRRVLGEGARGADD